jgi:hypothetical protein
MIRPLLLAIAGLAIAAPAASAHADARDGSRELASAATDGRVRIEQRTLVLAAGDGDDVIALQDGRRVKIDFGQDGVIDFEVAARRFDRIRVDGAGQDRLIVVGTAAATTTTPPTTPAPRCSSSSRATARTR